VRETDYEKHYPGFQRNPSTSKIESEKHIGQHELGSKNTVRQGVWGSKPTSTFNSQRTRSNRRQIEEGSTIIGPVARKQANVVPPTAHRTIQTQQPKGKREGNPDTKPGERYYWETVYPYRFNPFQPQRRGYSFPTVADTLNSEQENRSVRRAEGREKGRQRRATDNAPITQS
jgi:hypothetical protein